MSDHLTLEREMECANERYREALRELNLAKTRLERAEIQKDAAHREYVEALRKATQ